MADALGCSPTSYRRLESGEVAASLPDFAGAAALVGLELSASFYPAGQPIRDKGHQALIRRIRTVIAPRAAVFAEAPFPGFHDLRSWDLLVRIGDQRIGIEAETRIRDLQQLVRHMRERVRDGGVDIVVLFLADTRFNRALITELRLALGSNFTGRPKDVIDCLREGRALAGGAVVLI